MQKKVLAFIAWQMSDYLNEKLEFDV